MFTIICVEDAPSKNGSRGQQPKVLLNDFANNNSKYKIKGALAIQHMQ